MRKLYILLVFTFFIISTFSGCTKSSNNLSATTMEDAVAYEVSNIENISSFDDEQIKAISVVVRTKLTNKSNITEIDKSKINKKILEITKSTENEILFDGDIPAKTYYSYSIDNEVWHESIKKSSILSYMNKKGINLSNISDIQENLDDDGNIESLTIGGKTISYSELKNNFNLKSNKITEIKKNFSTIEISGQFLPNKNCLYLDKINDYSDKNYKQLLKHYYNDYDLKTIKNT